MAGDSFFDAMHISSSGMSAERTRMNVISNNLANANTTRTPEGGPYRRKVTVFQEVLDQVAGKKVPAGVKVSEVTEDTTPPKLEYRPNHPDADKDGFVKLPNISTVTEMVNMIAASRAYEANIQALISARGMINKALEIGK